MFAMFHLDYLSCLLTVLATILLARQSWIGLLVAIVQQFDRLCNWFANVTTWLYSSEPVLHLCIRTFSMRPWLKEQTDTKSRSRAARSSGSAAQNQEQPAVLRKRPAVRKAVLQDVPAVD